MGHQEEFLHGKHDPTLAQAAHSSGGIPIPAGTLQLCGCGTWGHGLGVALAVLGGWFELMLEGFSRLNDSVSQ